VAPRELAALDALRAGGRRPRARSSGCSDGGTSKGFDEMVEAEDRRCAKVVDAILDNLPPVQRIAIYIERGIMGRVFTFVRVTYHQALTEGKAALGRELSAWRVVTPKKREGLGPGKVRGPFCFSGPGAPCARLLTPLRARKATGDHGRDACHLFKSSPATPGASGECASTAAGRHPVAVLPPFCGRILRGGAPTNLKESCMAKLTAKRRNALPKSKFGEPGARKYPMPDKSTPRTPRRARAQQVKKGNLSPAEKSRIVAKANRILNGQGG
jgi:hypothetical protein